MTDKTGGPAFPVLSTSYPCPNSGDTIYESVGGKTLRDSFAEAAMTGDWASQSGVTGIWATDTAQSNLEDRAALYYRMADAMLKARENSND